VKILIRDELVVKVKWWKSPEATPDTCEERKAALLKELNHLGSVLHQRN